MKYRASLLILTALVVTAGFAAERDESSVRKRIDKIKKSEPSVWRKIPWTATLLDARRASEKEKKPIFLFTHDGNMQTGRC